MCQLFMDLKNLVSRDCHGMTEQPVAELMALRQVQRDCGPIPGASRDPQGGECT